MSIERARVRARSGIRNGRSAARAVALLGAALLLALGGAVPAQAADGDDGSVSWSARPADESAADGRAWVERELAPGASVVEHMEVRNYGAEATTFALTAADGYLTDKGRFNILPDDKPSTGAGLWIRIPDAVTVPAHGSAIVAYTVTVPQDAEPGDHPAGVAAAIRSRSADAGSAAVNVTSRVGFRVMIRVTGAYRTAVAPTVHAGYTLSWNPFQAGYVDVRYTVRNSGNTRVKVTPTVSARGLFGLAAQQGRGAAIEELLPGESRSGTVRLRGVWPTGPVDVRVELEAVPVAGDDPQGVTAASSTTVQAWPWPQLAVLVVAGLLAGLAVGDRRRRRRALQEQLARAREEGRREAEGAR